MIGTYRDIHFEDVKALWQEAFPEHSPWNVPEIVVPAKIAIQPDLFLIAIEDGHVVGSVIAGYDGHRGWIYALAVRVSYRGKGIASALLREAERRLEDLGCIKVNLQVRADNSDVTGIYKHLGYEVEERISMGKLLGSFAK